jgi:hypothetical protein
VTLGAERLRQRLVLVEQRAIAEKNQRQRRALGPDQRERAQQRVNALLMDVSTRAQHKRAGKDTRDRRYFVVRGIQAIVHAPDFQAHVRKHIEPVVQFARERVPDPQ